MARGPRPAGLPEQRLNARQIAKLTGLHRNTILGYMKPGGPLFCGLAMLGGRHTVPVSTYEAWVENGRIDR